MYSISYRDETTYAVALSPASSGAPEAGAISYDVFDTVLTRLWFRPTDLFLAVGWKLRREGLFGGTAAEWEKARCKAETAARSASRLEEVTLRQIYAELQQSLGWSACEATRAMACELAEEERAIRPIAETHNALAACRARGVPYLFISDTYFDTAFVADLLRRHGVGDTIQIYASAEHGVTKRSGRLFDLVLAETGLQPKRLTHVGDNESSDVQSARRRGVAGRLFRSQQPTRYERALYEMTGYDRLLRAAAAGCSRAARLQKHVEDPHRRVVSDAAANVAGPVLLAYVTWVLRTADRRGIRRLYFLARDGQILVRVARHVADWLGIDIDCRYLFVSRQSLFLPSLTTIDDAARDWFGDSLDGKSLRQILARVDVQADNIEPCLGRLGFERDRLDEALQPRDRDRVIGLLDDAELRSLVLGNAERRRADLLGYLRQNGFADGTPSALVDLGWKGRLQASLSRVLAAADDVQTALPLTGFYYALARRPGPEAGILLTFTKVGTGMNGPLLEMFCAADHGSVRSYERVAEGWVVPVLIEPRNDEAMAWGLEVQQKTIERFVLEFTSCVDPRDVDPAECEAFLAAGAARLFALLARQPSFEEATAFGGYPHADDQTHTDSRDLAPAFNRSDLRRRLSGLGPPSTTKSMWAEGSIVRGAGPGPAAALCLTLLNVRRGLERLLHRVRA